MTEDSAQRYLSNDRPGGGFWNALDQPVTDALVASAPKRAGSAENGVAHTTETPANSPIHARLSFGTGRHAVLPAQNRLESASSEHGPCTRPRRVGWKALRSAIFQRSVPCCLSRDLSLVHESYTPSPQNRLTGPRCTRRQRTPSLGHGTRRAGGLLRLTHISIDESGASTGTASSLRTQ